VRCGPLVHVRARAVVRVAVCAAGFWRFLPGEVDLGFSRLFGRPLRRRLDLLRRPGKAPVGRGLRRPSRNSQTGGALDQNAPHKWRDGPVPACGVGWRAVES